MKGLLKTFRELLRYPSAVAGLVIILILLAISVYAIITIPYKEAITLWRGGQDIWGNTPKLAEPAWFNFFRKDKLPDTIVLDSKKPASSTKGSVTKTVTPVTDDINAVTITYTIPYDYATFPQELAVHITSNYEQKRPNVQMVWITPDGRKINTSNVAVSKEGTSYVFSQDTNLQRKLGDISPEKALFLDASKSKTAPVNGTYQLQINAVTFEKDSTFDADFVLYGDVYGMAGTDYLRRDLMIPLLWGTPVALAFGLIAALGTTILTMLIAAIGVWYGGWVDATIQRITEINLVLPFLPILIMIGTFYSRSIWVILGATIILSVFGAAIKTYRANFLQVKESGYIEAARAYGASSARIVIRYLIPRMIPLLIPQLVILIPSYVFLEASLAVLGLGDPVLPTWGKIINDAESNGALYRGHYYWVLEPAILLMITGLAFAMLGFALDRIFNPRLREM